MGGAAHLVLFFLIYELIPVTHVTLWSLCCGFLAVSLVRGSKLAVGWFPVLCFRDSHPLDVGEGGSRAVGMPLAYLLFLFQDPP